MTDNAELQIKNPSNKLDIKVLLLIGFLTFIVIVTSIYLIINLKNYGTNLVVNSENDIEVEVEEEELESEPTDMFFYNQENNIFSYDTNSNQSVQLTNFLKTPSSGGIIRSLEHVKVIDNETIGFAQCEGNSRVNCKIYTLNLVTKNIQEVYVVEPQLQISQLDFKSKSEFALVVISDNEWNLYHVKDGEENILENIETLTYGRGVTYGDSFKLKFSKNGEYLLQISTVSARAPSDFNTYLYNLEDESKITIEASTDPIWFNENRILFRSVENQQGSSRYIKDLKTYNIVSKEIDLITTIDINDLSTILYNNILYYNDMNTQKVYAYDFNSNSHKLILENAVSLTFINDTHFVYYSTQPCTNCYGSYETNSINLFDIDNNYSVKINLDPMIISGIFSKYVE